MCRASMGGRHLRWCRCPWWRTWRRNRPASPDDLPVAVLEPRCDGCGDLAQVQLRAPAEQQRRPVRADRRQDRDPGCCGDRFPSSNRGDRSRGRVSGAIGSVGADGGVEVDQAASLVLRDPGGREPGDLAEGLGGSAEMRRQSAAQRDDEAVPELSGVGLPEHRADVVVAVGVDRRPAAGVVGVVVPHRTGTGSRGRAGWCAGCGCRRSR
jgi:hypothetical protein